MQADNYFKVRCGGLSLEFPFVTDYASDAARAEQAARDGVASLCTSAGIDPGSCVISVYDATSFPDYPQVGDWDENDLRESGESDSDLN